MSFQIQDLNLILTYVVLYSLLEFTKCTDIANRQN